MDEFVPVAKLMKGRESEIPIQAVKTFKKI